MIFESTLLRLTPSWIAFNNFSGLRVTSRSVFGLSTSLMLTNASLYCRDAASVVSTLGGGGGGGCGVFTFNPSFWVWLLSIKPLVVLAGCGGGYFGGGGGGF